MKLLLLLLILFFCSCNSNQSKIIENAINVDFIDEELDISSIVVIIDPECILVSSIPIDIETS